MKTSLSGALVFLTLAVMPVLAGEETNTEVLKGVWKAGQQEACSSEMRGAFNETSFKRISSRLTSETDRSALAAALNPFLFSLGYSHTQLFTEKDEAYYLYKGFQSESDPSAPPPPSLINPGIQVGSDDHGYFAREVLHGFPARAGGIIKGDRILTINGSPFAGSWGVTEATDAVVGILHQGQPRDVHLPLRAGNWSQAFQDATLGSIQTMHHKGFTFGYVRLWSGVHPGSVDALWTAVKKFKTARVDGVILDLRGGYGGAFWAHLDPFFPDRNTYFEMTATDGDNKTITLHAKPQANADAFAGPMSVLINEGSRSGKEALAYQFKKSNRATVIGTATPGYFSGGKLLFIDQPVNYILYLCIRRDSKLDGIEVEGIGIRPNISVEFDTHNELQDSQLKAGLEQLTETIKSTRG